MFAVHRTSLRFGMMLGFRVSLMLEFATKTVMHAPRARIHFAVEQLLLHLNVDRLELSGRFRNERKYTAATAAHPSLGSPIPAARVRRDWVEPSHSIRG